MPTVKQLSFDKFEAYKGDYVATGKTPEEALSALSMKQGQVVARNEGKEAARKGLTEKSNPYKKGTFSHDSWKKGYEMGKIIHKKKPESKGTPSALGYDAGLVKTNNERGCPFSEGSTAKIAWLKGFRKARENIARSIPKKNR